MYDGYGRDTQDMCVRVGRDTQDVTGMDMTHKACDRYGRDTQDM